MKKNALLLVLVMLFSAFATMPVAALVFESTVREATIVVMAIPPTDDSMKNPYYELLGVEKA